MCKTVKIKGFAGQGIRILIGDQYMGRKSKLSDAQWGEFERRLLSGEKQADLCREYGVSKQVASARFSGRKNTINDVANQIVTANRNLMNLDQSGQSLAIDLARSLMTISENMAHAAISGSYTAMRLNQIAANQIDKIDEDNPLNSEEHIRSIAMLTKTGNEASLISRELLNAQAKKKETGAGEDDEIPTRVAVKVIDARR